MSTRHLLLSAVVLTTAAVTVTLRPDVIGLAAGTAAATTQARIEDTSTATPRRILYYRNPMGLPDTSPEPRKDSMGMDYIPVYEETAGDAPGAVRIAVEKVQRAGVRTEPAVRREVVRTVRAFGTVEPDESRIAVVTARFDGFVEELFVPLTGTQVKAGVPLLRVWIESSEILQKQADYLLALNNQAGRKGDLQRTERNLQLFGLPAESINVLRETGTPVRSLVLTAPRAGTVMLKPALVGMRFGAGDVLFKTADLSVVWVVARVSERDLGLVRVGQIARVTLNAAPETPLAGRVDFIYPEVDPATRTARVRIVLANDAGEVRSGQYADVELQASIGGGPVIAIPESALIDSGSRRVVFVSRGDGVFEPREVALGGRGNGWVEVRAGVAEGEQVVVTGNFLIDAESNLRAALAGLVAPDAGPPAAADGVAAAPAPAAPGARP